MKRVKRLLAALLVVAMVASMPLSAFAKKVKGTVPTSGDFYHTEKYKEYYDGSHYVEKERTYKTGSFTTVYNKKGQIKQYKYTDVFYSTIQIDYKWKGDFLKSVTRTVIEKDFEKLSADRDAYVEVEWDENYTAPKCYKVWDKAADKYIEVALNSPNIPTDTSKTVTTYKYAKKLLKKVTTTTTTTEAGKAPETSSSVEKFKWNKRTATVKATNKGSGNKYIYTLKVNKSKKKTSSWDGQWKNKYKNGILTKYSGSYKGTLSSSTDEDTYDKYGYPVSSVYGYSDKDNSWSNTTIYTPTANGVAITNRYVDTYADPAQKSRNRDETTKNSVVYTATMPVKQMRNCDKFGTKIWLGNFTSEYVGSNGFVNVSD